MPKRSSQGFFDFQAMMPLTKTADQIATEKILASAQREEPPTPESVPVMLDMRARMRAQRIANQVELKGGGKPKPNQRPRR